MAVSSFAADAIVLRATPFGDADLVIHLLTRTHGRIGAFARGARRSSRRFPGGLEPFALLRAEWRERRGADLVELTGSTIETAHLGLREDLGRLAQAGYVVELARELSRDHEANPRLYGLVAGMLGLLSAKLATPLLVRALELQVLGSAGFAPALESCPRCGRAASGAVAMAFDAALGGVACAGCAAPGASPVTLQGVAMLRVLGARPLAEIADASLPEVADDLRTALQGFVRHHVHHQLKSVDFLRATGAPW